MLDKNPSSLANKGNPSKASFLKYGPGKIFSGLSIGNIYVADSEVSFTRGWGKGGNYDNDWGVCIVAQAYAYTLSEKNHIVWLKGQCNSQLISGILLK